MATKTSKTAPAPLATVSAAALVAPTQAQASLATYLDELQTWLELPFASPRYLQGHLFTLLKHGETEFASDKTDANGEPVMEATHLWLAVAQAEIEYINNAGEVVNIAAGDQFIISQRMNKLRDMVAVKVQALLAEAGSIPNVTMRAAKVGKKAASKGWSAPITFAVVPPTHEG